jgi:hypothetical protein
VSKRLAPSGKIDESLIQRQINFEWMPCCPIGTVLLPEGRTILIDPHHSFITFVPVSQHEEVV